MPPPKGSKARRQAAISRIKSPFWFGDVGEWGAMFGIGYPYYAQFSMGGGMPGPFKLPSPFISEIPVSAKPPQPVSRPNGTRPVQSPGGVPEAVEETLGGLVQTQPVDRRTPPRLIQEPLLIEWPIRIPLPYDSEGEEMAIDWGQAISGAIDIFQGQNVGGNYPSQSFVSGPTGQPYSAMTRPPLATLTGKPPCKPRRRRRRLLTEGDFNDLMRIATLPNKQNVTVALAKAVGRR